jgi:phage terminase small subunit
MDVETAAQIAALPSVQALPVRKRLFALSYIVSSNGAKACRDAGYKENPKHDQQLSRQAGRLLGDGAVAAAVREGQAIRWRALQMSADEVLARASRIARHDHRKVIEQASKSRDLAALDDDTAEALQGVKVRRELDKHGNVKAETVEYKVASKLGAIELLAKYHRLLANDASVGDFGQAFADAMERAGNRASLRASANAAEDAIIPSTQGAPDALASEVAEDFARGGTQ